MLAAVTMLRPLTGCDSGAARCRSFQTVGEMTTLGPVAADESVGMSIMSYRRDGIFEL